MGFLSLLLPRNIGQKMFLLDFIPIPVFVHKLNQCIQFIYQSHFLYLGMYTNVCNPLQLPAPAFRFSDLYFNIHHLYRCILLYMTCIHPILGLFIACFNFSFTVNMRMIQNDSKICMSRVQSELGCQNDSKICMSRVQSELGWHHMQQNDNND